MSGKLILYNVNLSFPVRAVKIVARLLDLELELRYVNNRIYLACVQIFKLNIQFSINSDIDLLNGEQLKEPFVKVRKNIK